MGTIPEGKRISEKAEALLADRGISTKAKFFEGLKTLDEIASKISKMAIALTAYKDLYTRLSDGCSDYAEDHASVFNEAVTPDRDGVASGLLEVDGVQWRFTKSANGYQRISGSNMTAKFLQDLGKEYPSAIRPKYELNTSGLTGLNLTVSQLAELDLVRSTSRKWARV